MSESAPPKFRTLAAANNGVAELHRIIQSLQAQVAGHGPPAGGKPVPGRVDTQPVGGNEPIPPPPQDPHPILPGRNPPINPDNRFTLDLRAMAPKPREDFISRCSDKDVKVLLARETAKPAKEQDPKIIGLLYRELKKRGY